MTFCGLNGKKMVNQSDPLDLKSTQSGKFSQPVASW